MDEFVVFNALKNVLQNFTCLVYTGSSYSFHICPSQNAR